jgi:hypothetical protein
MRLEDIKFLPHPDIGSPVRDVRYGPLRDVRHREQFQLGRRFFQQPGLRRAPGIIPIILTVRIGCVANYVHLYGAIRISQTTLQTPVKLGQ